ncbi:MAG TPA: histidine kinase [Clostridiales bacterium]|nr:histidine kinase [Clostridiales bacterium]
MNIINAISSKIANSKLKIQLTISFIVTSFFVLLLSSIFTYIGVLNILKNRSDQFTEKQFRQFDYNIQVFANEVDKISKLLLLDEKLQNFLEQEYEYDNSYTNILVCNDLYSKLFSIIQNYSYIDSIFIFTEDGRILGVTASTNEYLNDSNKKNGFYSSDMYKLAKSSSSSLAWAGGGKSEDFNLNKIPNSRKNINIISAVRGIKPFYQNLQKATLVINIQESVITSIYSNIYDPLSSTYIVDSNGKIISDIDATRIGSNSFIFTKLDKNLDNGSFTLKIDSVTKQIFYLKLTSLDWTLINEIDYKNYIKDIHTMRNILILMFFACIAISLALSTYWGMVFTKPIKRIINAIKEVGKGNIGITITESPKNEFGMIIRQFNEMSISIEKLIHENKMIEEMKRKQDIAVLQLQINPHFIYNTLNTIKLMAVMINAKNIVEGITIFGNILSPIFKDPSPIHSIEEEFNFLKNYIKIMNLRYGEGVKIVFNIQEDLIKCKILKFIVQPLVENALYHGLAEKNYNGEIKIEIAEENENVIVTISDNGAGMTVEKLREIEEMCSGLLENSQSLKGIGIRNVDHRVKLYFGVKYGLKIQSKIGSGTSAILRLPKIGEDEVQDIFQKS